MGQASVKKKKRFAVFRLVRQEVYAKRFSAVNREAVHPRRKKPRSLSENARYVIRLAIFTALIFLAFCALRPTAFLSPANLSSMAYQLPEFAILALAIHPTMLTGGIDLSVVSVANLSAIIAAFLMRGLPPQIFLLSVPVALLVGSVAGATNGLLIAGARLPAILATLGTLQFFAGIGIILTKGSSITGLPSSYAYVGNGAVLGIPVPLLVFILALGVIYIVTARMLLGKQMRLYGTNSRAAPFAGNLLLAVLINILAGVNPNGGSGTVFGLVLAVLSLQFLSSGLNLLSVNNFARDLLYGALLVTVMVANRLQRRIHSTRVKT